MILLNGLEHCFRGDRNVGSRPVPILWYKNDQPGTLGSTMMGFATPKNLIWGAFFVVFVACQAFSVPALAVETKGQAAKSSQTPAAKAAKQKAPVTTSSKSAAKSPPVKLTSVAATKPRTVPTSVPVMAGSTYAVKLRDLESRVDELKEQIRRSHTRLSLLSDSILSGGVGGARAEIRFKNELSGAFRLTRALFILDGAVQYNKEDDTGSLAEQKEIPIFKGSIPPGDHTLQILLKLRGHGYGVFSYLRGYQFDVKESHSFSVTEGKEVELEVIAWEKGGVTTPLEERPAIRHLERIKNVTGPVAPPPATGPAGAATQEN